VVQAEKEQSDFVIGEQHENPVSAAVSAYYERLIELYDQTAGQRPAGTQVAAEVQKSRY
jgi:hypothetical protein